MTRKILGGNWKMHKTLMEAEEFFNKFVPLFKSIETDYEIVFFPSYTSLQKSVELTNNTEIKIGAQNMHYEDEGAFTGEVSPLMLKEIGITYVLIGHSERRKYFQETEEILRRKNRKAIDFGFKVMYCVGETLRERENNEQKEVVERQLRKGLSLLTDEDLFNLSIAYEPVWAIGTGKTATPEQAEDMHEFIKSVLKEMYGVGNIPVLYGGSVKPDNVESLTAMPHIDGALVGGASLKPETFLEIIKHSM